MSKVDFAYTNSQALNTSGTMTIQQGILCAIIGAPESGKSTILRILGGVVLPKPGGFFIPAHLRVLHVDREPFFFHGTLLENLSFGVRAGDPDGQIDRVLRIC